MNMTDYLIMKTLQYLLWLFKHESIQIFLNVRINQELKEKYSNII
jgi:hypothetical protein